MPAYRCHCPKGILQVVHACYLMAAGEAVCETYGSCMERMYNMPLISTATSYAKKITRVMSEGYHYRKPTSDNPNAREPEEKKTSWVTQAYREFPFVAVGKAVTTQKKTDGSAYGPSGGQNRNSTFQQGFK